MEQTLHNLIGVIGTFPTSTTSAFPQETLVLTPNWKSFLCGFCNDILCLFNISDFLDCIFCCQNQFPCCHIDYLLHGACNYLWSVDQYKMRKTRSAPSYHCPITIRPLYNLCRPWTLLVWYLVDAGGQSPEEGLHLHLPIPSQPDPDVRKPTIYLRTCNCIFVYWGKKLYAKYAEYLLLWLSKCLECF